MSKTTYTKLENRVTKLERKVAGQQSELMELQTNNKHNESAIYNNLIQSINSANTNISSMLGNIQAMKTRTDSLEVELKKTVQFTPPVASNQEPPTTDNYVSQIVDCHILPLVDSNGKHIQEDKIKGFQQ